VSFGSNDPRFLSDSDVVVAGLGPVGATAALTLAEAGKKVTVFEQSGELESDPSESRASTFHPPTLEILDDLGVADELHQVGLISDTYQHRDRTHGLIAHFDLGVIAEDTRFPYRLQSEQRNLVEIIRRKLSGISNVRLVLGTKVVSADADADDADGVTVLVEPTGAGEVSGAAGAHRARWLIAADGASSSVRRSLGLDFPGMTYPEQFLVVSSTEDFAELIPGIASVNYISDPHEWFVLLRTPVHWRALFPIPPGEDASERALDPAAVQERMQAITALPRGYRIAHARIYRVHQRIAERFRVGRVLLAGDAAHINNPLGGMGMNSGIHDAAAAAAAILAADRGDDGPADAYDEQRRAVAHDYVRVVTHRNWELLKEQDPAERERQQEQIRRTAADPAAARDYLLRSSMLAGSSGR
jgi:3-(3-hydroxy-phenyl)propionate hydroxylase